MTEIDNGPHGVGGRRYRIPAEAAPWMLAFRVSSDYEYKTFLVSLTALAIALISLGVAFLGSM